MIFSPLLSLVFIIDMENEWVYGRDLHVSYGVADGGRHWPHDQHLSEKELL